MLDILENVFTELQELSQSFLTITINNNFINKLMDFYTFSIKNDASRSEIEYLEYLRDTSSSNKSNECIVIVSELDAIENFYKVLFNDWDNPVIDSLYNIEINCKSALKILNYPEMYRVQLKKLYAFREILIKYLS